MLLLDYKMRILYVNLPFFVDLFLLENPSVFPLPVKFQNIIL